MGDGYGADWKLYVSHEYFLVYYDEQSITHPSKNIVRVWTRWDYTEKGEMMFKKKYENLNYKRQLEGVDCVGKRDRILSFTSYDKEGRVINSASGGIEWDDIVPESVADALYKKVCGK